MSDLELRKRLAELAGWTEIVELAASYDPVAGREIRVSGLGGKAPIGTDGVGIGVGLVIPAYELSLDAQARDLWPLLRESGLSYDICSSTFYSRTSANIPANGVSVFIDYGDSHYPEAEAMGRAIVEALSV